MNVSSITLESSDLSLSLLLSFWIRDDPNDAVLVFLLLVCKVAIISCCFDLFVIASSSQNTVARRLLMWHCKWLHSLKNIKSFKRRDISAKHSMSAKVRRFLKILISFGSLQPAGQRTGIRTDASLVLGSASLQVSEHSSRRPKWSRGPASAR